MGSIVNINFNPRNWSVQDIGYFLKAEFGGEKLLWVEYGTFNDYPEGDMPMGMHMRRSVYRNLIERKYRIDRAKTELTILDQNGDPVAPLVKGVIY